ncbi:TonB-dependent receptor [Snuella sedimenti]|uniref:TonB-dependent receptor n=1 Tax=Snuella sedimenti TaxID=2798802 RepID=A0A8J7LSZ8_9FLAO|nr:TonB-dependent receptor [Snuella sedimenti]MBJ6368970.1 TonB-dependent receptor [Snuella sedimenti]
MKKKTLFFSKIPIVRIMKIYLVLICISLTKIFAIDAYSQSISLNAKNEKIKTILNTIEGESNYSFFYNSSIINVNKKRSLNVTNADLEEALKMLFIDTEIDFSFVRNQIILYPKNQPELKLKLENILKSNEDAIVSSLTLEMINEFISSSLQQKISGTVTDNTGMPLPGVSIIIKGTTLGTTTDFDGNYSINAPKTNDVLVFSYIGYATKEININNQSTINITLEEAASQLEEVVVVGYGVQKKINVTGSVASIKADDVVTTPATNVKGLIVGQIPGVITNQTPGLPGNDNVSLSIRGFGSPLVIVDGVESFLDRIDPNDIETISVLKDASAAIYGVRGGDGVILITTKRGKSGKVELNYHGYAGIQKPVKFPTPVTAADYIKAKRNGSFNAQYDPANSNDPIAYGDFTEDYLAEYESGAKQSYNWVDALLKGGGSQITSHNISANGGSEKVRFYTSLGLLTQDGIFKGDYSYKKLNLTNNLDAKITDDLSLSLNSSYIDETRDYAAYGVGTIWNDLRTAQPFFRPELPDPNRAPYSGFTERSPVARTQKKFGGYSLTTLETLAAAMELKYNVPFLQGLTIGAKANVRMRRIYFEDLSKTYTVYQYNEEDANYTPIQTVNQEPSFSKGVTSSGSDPRVRFLSRFYLNYNNNFGKHKIGALAFMEKEDNEVDQLAATRRNLLSDDVPTIEAGDDANTTTFGTARPLEYSRISFAGRFNYAFDDKYLLEATLRADASSKVSPKVRWGYFPSVSLGWNIAKENFLKNSAINELKLRLSYSKTGKDSNIGNTSFDYLTGFNELSSVYYLDGNPVTNIITAGLVNDRLTWIKNTLYNAGLDFRLLNGKFYGNVDVFYRLSEGLVAADIESVPSTFGANLPQVNLNSTNDHGFEFIIGYKGSIGDLKLDLSGNFSFARARYGDWAQDINLDDPNQVRINLRNGRYINRSFGYISDGLINTQTELDDYVVSHTFETLDGSPKVGDIRYVDVNGPDGTPDGVIDLYDRREIGYGSDPDITYGLNTRLTYKNFSLAMLWQGASLFNVNISGGNMRAPFNNEQVPLTLHAKYSWTQDPNSPGTGNNPNAKLPAYNNDGSRIWNDNFSDFWQKDGTYVRLKTATLSYNLSQKTLDKIGFNNCTFYLTGDNLFAFTKLGIYEDLIDPEQAYNNSGYSLPLLRTYTFGVRIGL